MQSRAKLPTKKPSNSNLSLDALGNKQRLPADIAAELEKKNLVPRFVSVKKLEGSGGFHERGWQVYQLEKGLTNPITGNVDKIYRVGDLVLAVKTQEDHAKHKELLRRKAAMQSGAVEQSKREIRDKIKENKAGRYVQMIDGYEENE